MEFPKILVASPTYEGMGYCDQQFINSLKSLDYPDYDILLVDNSEDNEYFDKLNKIQGIKVLRDESDERNKMLRLVNSRNKIIDYAYLSL